jgi:hypothetical protein
MLLAFPEDTAYVVSFRGIDSVSYWNLIKVVGNVFDEIVIGSGGGS